MNVRRRIAWSLRFIAIACCAAMLTGCLDAEKTVMIAYDAATDTFTYLVVYQQLRELSTGRPNFFARAPATNPTAATAPATQPDDGGAADLRAIAANRANLLVNPAPTFLLIDFGLLKQSNGKGVFRNVLDLTNDSNSSPPTDITGTRIIPGSFFMRGKDDLCYYQGAEVPGAVVDRGIDMFNNSKDDQTVGIQESIDAKKAAKGPPVTWTDAGKMLADWVEHYDGGSDSAKYPDKSQSPLSIESLQMLLNQGKHHDFKLRRHGSTVTVDLKLIEHDIDGAVQADGVVRKAVENRLKELADPKVQQTIQNGSDGLAMLRGELAVVAAITLTKPDSHRLRINFDLIRFCTAGTLRPTDPPVSLGPYSDSAAEIGGVAEKSVPIDAHTTVEQLQADFLAGKLTGLR